MKARALVALAALASGCVLIVDGEPPEATTTCPLRGAETRCGRCITNVCRAALDLCCGSASCRPEVPKIEACALNPTEQNCALGSTGLFPFVSTVGTCVEVSCGFECRPGGGQGAGGAGGAGPGGSGGLPPLPSNEQVSSLDPCLGDDACDAAETCDPLEEVCRKRCEGDASGECGGGFCYLGHCTDPVGTPCDDTQTTQVCGGAECVNVTDAGTIAPGYCTHFCSNLTRPCPAGYVCDDAALACRVPARGSSARGEGP